MFHIVRESRLLINAINNFILFSVFRVFRVKEIVRELKNLKTKIIIIENKKEIFLKINLIILFNSIKNTFFIFRILFYNI